MKRSRLVLGTVQFGMKYGVANTHGRTTPAEVQEILRVAADAGIQMLDTASDYGESEVVLGDALQATGLTGTMKIISKTGKVPTGLTTEQADKYVRDSVIKSLKNLKVERLYGMLYHEEYQMQYYSSLQKLEKEGLIENAGCSIDGEAPESLDLCKFIQIPGNVLDRRFLAAARRAHARGATVFNRSVYLQGLLLMPEEAIPEGLKPVLPHRRKLEAIAAEAGIKPAEMYVRYLLSLPEIDGVLTGVDTPEQLRYNASVAEQGALPPAVLQQILEAIPELPEAIIRPSRWPRKKA